MSRTTTTIYLCDACGNETLRKELRRFQLTATKISGREWFYTGWSELCAKCESDLLSAVSQFLDHADGQFEKMARPE